MPLTTEERAEFDALKATVKQLQTQVAAKTGVAIANDPGLPERQRARHPPSRIEFPIQGAPATVDEPEIVVPVKKAGPSGKATPEQAFVDPEGRSFDDNAPPSIVPAR